MPERIASTSKQVQLSVAWDDDRCLLAVGGELDIATEAFLYDALTAALAVAGELTVDLDDVTFADCAGISVLSRAARIAHREGKRLTVRNHPPSVERIAEVVPSIRRFLTSASPAAPLGPDGSSRGTR